MSSILEAIGLGLLIVLGMAIFCENGVQVTLNQKVYQFKIKPGSSKPSEDAK